jgi:hypothetical protein
MKWSTDWDLSTIPDVFLLSEAGKRANRRRLNVHNGGNKKYKGTETASEIAKKARQTFEKKYTQLRNNGNFAGVEKKKQENEKSKREKYG